MKKWNLQVILSLLFLGSFASAKMTIQNEKVGKKVDILFVIDNSGSMEDFQEALIDNLSVLTQKLPEQGIDFHIGVTTTDSHLGASKELRLRDGTSDQHSGVFVVTSQTQDIEQVLAINLLQGTDGAGEEFPFLSFKQVLNFPANGDFHRVDAELAVIAVGDEDDSSSKGGWMIPTADFATYLAKVGGASKATFSAITVLDRSCKNQNRNILSVRMVDLVKLTRGYQGSICDMKNSLEGFVVSIAAVAPPPASYIIKLDHTPVVETIVVKVNGRLIKQDAENGWTYDAATNQLTLRGSAIPTKGAYVSVAYDYQE